VRAARLHGPRDLRVEEVADLGISPDEVLLRVRSAAICATDVRIFAFGDRRVRYPVILGHEIAGDVETVGSELRGLVEEGTRVVVNPTVSCGRCRFCSSGRQELCQEIRTIGIHLDGGLAQLARVPGIVLGQRGLYAIPEDVTYDEAALTEPLSCCIHGQALTRVAAGETVVVIGAGAIGLMHAVLAKHAGPRRVIAVETDPQRLRQAAEFGCDVLLNPSEQDFSDRLSEATDGEGADVVIVAAGSAEAQRQAILSAGVGGRIVFFAGLPPGQGEVGLNTNLIHYRELSVVGSYASTPHEMERALELVQSHSLQLEKLITHRFSLEKAAEAFQVASSKVGLKVAVHP